MSTLNRRSTITFQPSAVRVREAIEEAKKTDRYEDPPDHVTLFGHMTGDAEIITELIRGLPFAGAEYRSNLRITRGACKRLAARCTKLLGDDE
jgi:hypothetical protein